MSCPSSGRRPEAEPSERGSLLRIDRALVFLSALRLQGVNRLSALGAWVTDAFNVREAKN